MADHVSSALYVYTKETEPLIKQLQANSFGTVITPVAIDESLQRSCDRSCINSMIRSTFNFMGVMGDISIGPVGKATRPLFINPIQGERMKYIVKVY